MWPTLFRIPLPSFLQDLFHAADIPIRSFGLMVMLGFLVGLWTASRLARRFGADPVKDPQRVGDLAFWLLVGIIAGGRLLYVIVHHEQFAGNPFRIFAFWEGGMVFYGGFLMSFWLGAVKAKRYGLDFWPAADILIVAGMLGYGIGRWGCLLVGDDYGRETTVPWAIRVPNPLPPDSLFEDNAGKYLHPTQLYMSLNGFTIAAICRWLLPRKKFHGQICWTGILLYAIGRFIIEFFRGDDKGRGIYGFFSTSQWIGIGLAVVAVVMLRRGFSTSRGKGGGNAVAPGS